MKSNDISRAIEDFEKSGLRAILIDGPWGCGKTYQIRNFLSKQRKKSLKKIYYLSLTGKETIDEINTELYKMIHPCKYARKSFFSGMTLISKAFLPEKSGDLVSNINVALNKESKKKISKRSIIIFDDLERVDKKISLRLLLGYINSLYMSSVRVVCVASTDNFLPKHKIEFSDFKEKVFDRIYIINETEEEIINKYFEKYKVENLDLILDEFNNNIRLAQKTAIFYNEVLDWCIKNNIKIENKLSNLELVRNCLFTLKMCFKEYLPPDFDKIKGDNTRKLVKSFYNINRKKYNEMIANALFHEFTNKKIDKKIEVSANNEYPETLVKSLLSIFVLADYNDFLDMFLSKDNVIEDNLLKNNIFLLSDGNKRKYTDEFIKNIYTGNVEFDDTNINRFMSVLAYSQRDFSDEEKDKIIESIFRNCSSNKKILELSDKLLDKFKFSHYSTIKDANIWIQKIKKQTAKSREDKALLDFKKMKSNNYYDEMQHMIYDINKIGDKEEYERFIAFIVSNDFFLPDLGGNITASSWGYSHVIAEFAHKFDRGDKFVELALKICNKDRKNESLINRFDLLIKTYINKTYDIRNEIK